MLLRSLARWLRYGSEGQGLGRGQVVDAAMVDGTALLTQMTLSLRAAMAAWTDDRARQPARRCRAASYDTYGCADHRYVAVGALESAVALPT